MNWIYTKRKLYNKIAVSWVYLDLKFTTKHFSQKIMTDLLLLFDIMSAGSAYRVVQTLGIV